MIHQGDSYELLRRVPQGSVNLLLTDPPYGVSRENNLHTMGRAGLEFGIWDDADHGWIALAVPLLAPGASVVVWQDIWKLGEVAALLRKLGLEVRRDLIWRKSNPMPRNRDRTFVQTTEHAVWATAPGRWTFNRSKPYESGVLEYPVPRARRGRTRHPTQKPLGLFRELVEVLSNPGDLVLDPFAGVGTTAVACALTGRRHLSFEQEPAFVAEGRLRLQEVRVAQVSDLSHAALDGF